MCISEVDRVAKIQIKTFVSARDTEFDLKHVSPSHEHDYFRALHGSGSIIVKQHVAASESCKVKEKENGMAGVAALSTREVEPTPSLLRGQVGLADEAVQQVEAPLCSGIVTVPAWTRGSRWICTGANWNNRTDGGG